MAALLEQLVAPGQVVARAQLVPRAPETVAAELAVPVVSPAVAQLARVPVERGEARALAD